MFPVKRTKGKIASMNAHSKTILDDSDGVELRFPWDRDRPCAFQPVGGNLAVSRSPLAPQHATVSTPAMDAYARARELIDAAHAADPTRAPDGRAAELVYADRVEAWVARLEASISSAGPCRGRRTRSTSRVTTRGDVPSTRNNPSVRARCFRKPACRRIRLHRWRPGSRRRA